MVVSCQNLVSGQCAEGVSTPEWCKKCNPALTPKKQLASVVNQATEAMNDLAAALQGDGPYIALSSRGLSPVSAQYAFVCPLCLTSYEKGSVEGCHVRSHLYDVNVNAPIPQNELSLLGSNGLSLRWRNGEWHWRKPLIEREWVCRPCGESLEAAAHRAMTLAPATTSVLTGDNGGFYVQAFFVDDVRKQGTHHNMIMMRFAKLESGPWSAWSLSPHGWGVSLISGAQKAKWYEQITGETNVNV